jgi:hypothetical protein
MAAAACVSKPTAPSPQPQATVPGSFTITITGPESVAPGADAHYQATARTSDGRATDITGSAKWSSSNAQVLNVQAGGAASGHQPGTARVSVRFEDVEQSIAVRVIESNAEDRTISGTMWIHDATVTAATGGLVFGWVERPGSGRTTGPVLVSALGRYQFKVPKDTLRVSVFGGPGHQPCAAAQVITADATLDVHRVVDRSYLNGNLPAVLRAQTPTLSGVVYENTAQGRRPIPDAWVTLDGLGGMGVLVADTRSDAQGRYLLCNVPQTPSMAIVVGADGFAIKEVYHPELADKTTLDIEMRRVAVGHLAEGPWPRR